MGFNGRAAVSPAVRGRTILVGCGQAPFLTLTSRELF